MTYFAYMQTVLTKIKTALKRINNVCYRDAKTGSIMVARLDHIQQIDLK